MAKKVTAAQRECLARLADGWELGVDQTLGGGVTVQRGGIGRGARRGSSAVTDLLRALAVGLWLISRAIALMALALGLLALPVLAFGVDRACWIHVGLIVLAFAAYEGDDWLRQNRPRRRPPSDDL